jgi:hypothetical protein
VSPRNTFEILNDVKALVKSKGYIYALCLIILDDFHIDIEKIDQVDIRSKLNKNETLLLLGFLIQSEINVESPDSPFDLLTLKKRTYELMEELHHSTMLPFINKIKPLLEKPTADRASTQRSFFGDEGMFIEPIFYSGDGIYDFQYLEFLDRKYKYDEAWLNSSANFHFDKVKKIVAAVKSSHQKKITSVNFLGLKDNKAKILKDLKKDKSLPKEKREEQSEQFFNMLEFYQYDLLFETKAHEAKGLSPEEVTENGWKSFYRNLIDLFTISQNEFSADLNIDSFLERFSIPSDATDRNKQFQNIGDFNLIAVRPFIRIEPDRFFIPISYSLFEAVYEGPFYWMLDDNAYKDKLAENRGKAGEEIVFELLTKVFGKERVHKSIKIVSEKGRDETDIDVLCILGSKALCVQVKSKKLTQLSRRGDGAQLRKDFKGAIQDAYEQALICKARILDKKAIFFDENGGTIQLSEDIEDVYLPVVTTENYPSLAHQSRTLLEKKDSDPHALILTVFDLELSLFYLTNPYDFLYYVRQRIALMEYYIADEEMYFLGYHLLHKLWRDPEATHVVLDNEYGQLIDQNYYLFKLDINLPSKDDKIKNRWKNSRFEELCNQIAEQDSPKKTDIIFYLLDWSAEARDNLMNQFEVTKGKTKQDGKAHNMSMMSGPEGTRFGITYISWNNNSQQELIRRLFRHCRGRKYKSKADAWIGLGSLNDSPRIVDAVVFSDEKWRYDQSMEEEVKLLFEGVNKGTAISFGKKVGRNDPCPCGSGLKNKKCCGK